MGKCNPEVSAERQKAPAWTRALDVALRTAHVAVAGVLFGGTVFGVPFYRLLSWHHLAIATGGALIASEVCHRRHWPYQGRGLMVFLHIGFLGLIHLRPDLRVPALTAALVFGMVGSHMPKNLRYWSCFPGRAG
jgi:hypothetical protein